MHALYTAPRHTARSAFATRNLSVFSFSQGVTLWLYKSGDLSLADVAAPGFFAEACDMMSGGDMIMVTGAHGATIRVVSGVGLDRVDTAGMV